MADDIGLTFLVDNNNISYAIRRLKHLDAANFDDTLFDIARLLGVHIEELGLDYPPQPEPRKPPPRYSKKTGKRLKDRKPKRYKRTGRLGSSMTSEPRRPAPNVYSAVYGTDVDYAPYVLAMPSDDPGQAWYHQGVWTPLEDTLTAILPELRTFVYNELMRRINAFLV